MKTTALLAAALALTGCATSYVDVQALTPVAVASTPKTPNAFVACYLPKVLEVRGNVRVRDEGANKVVFNHEDMFGMTGFALTVTPAGEVAMRHNPSGSFGAEWRLAQACL